MSQSTGKEENAENRGQQSKENETLVLVATEQQQNACLLSELPEEVLSHILSYVGIKELLSLSSVCSSLLKAMEAFSKQSLEELKTKHNVDDTWEDRIRVPPSSIETTIQDQLELPYRYLLWKAHRTYLYSLKNRGDFVGLGALPDGERLVSCCDMIRMWDLSTKDVSITFDHSEDYPVYSCFLHEDYVIVTFWGASVLVFSALDGRILHNVRSPDRVDDDDEEVPFVSAIAASQQTLYFTFKTFEESITILDLITGNVRRQELSERAMVVFGTGSDSQRMIEDPFQVPTLICGTLFLALQIGVGIHVFDVTDFSSKGFFSGTHHSFSMSADDPNTIVAVTMDTIDVLALENGSLSRHFAFPRLPSLLHKPSSKDLMLVHESLAYVHKGLDAPRAKQWERWATMDVYNITNGKLVRTYEFPTTVTHASTNGHEVFFAFDHHHRRIPDLDGGIRAYCLPTIE